MPHGHEPDEEKLEKLRDAMYSRTLSDKLHPRDRRALERDPDMVPSDFVRKEAPLAPAIVAPRGMSFMRRALAWILGIAILFFIGASGFFVYYFLLGAGSSAASPDNVAITIAGPGEIEGGNATELQIIVQNKNSVALQNAELVLSYPKGTRSPGLTSADEYSCSGPENTSNPSLALPQQRICLGDIESGGQRQGTVTAVFSGISGQHETLKAELEYRLPNSNALFVATSKYDLAFGSSPLSISVDGNTQTTSGQPLTMTVHVASRARQPVRDVLLSMQAPFGFTLTSSTPPPTSSNFWSLGDIAPGQTKDVVINGTLNGQTNDDRVFTFTTGTRTATSSQAIDTTLASIAQHVTIAQPFLGIDATVNGNAGDISVLPGDSVKLTINYQNNLDVPIANGIIVAKLSGLEIDGTTVQTENGFYRSTDDSMIWDKTTDPDLATIAPGQKGSVSVTFSMPSGENLGSVPKLTMSISATGDRVGQTGVPQSLLASITRNVSVATDLEYTAQGLYYSNPFGSSGPLPPKAGQETSYALVFTITNTTAKITNAVLTAQLPPYVRWLQKWAPANENVTFNQLDGTITWHIGDIDPGVGTRGTQPRQMAIAIGFTPSTSQIGTSPVLLSNITLTGINDSTGDQISLPISEGVTTDLTRVGKSSRNAVSGVDAGFTSSQGTVVQ